MGCRQVTVFPLESVILWFWERILVNLCLDLSVVTMKVWPSKRGDQRSSVEVRAALMLINAFWCLIVHWSFSEWSHSAFWWENLPFPDRMNTL